MRGDRLRAGIAAAAVWLLGALLASLLQRDFMDRLGWDVWPSGLALGPWGWLQAAVFLAFSAALLAFGVELRGLPLSAPGRWGSRLLLMAAAASLLLVFRTDPPGQPTTWHGALHAAGYLVMMPGLVVSLLLVLPGVVRRTRPRHWPVAALSLLLLPPALAMPTAAGRNSYLFFAVPFVALAAEALLLASAVAGAAEG